jgi:RNA polymerase sigma-70 factor, ECF subfamily
LKNRIHNEEGALSLICKGKEEGLHYFFDKYYTPISFFVARLTRNQDFAEEITADVFIKLWNKREELQPNRSIKAWLYQTANNAAIDWLRQQKRMAVHEKGLHYIYPKEEKNILHQITEAETIQQIVKTLEQLPPGCQEVFKLAYLLQKTDKEIAKELGLSHHTVRNQKLRAIRLLQKKVGPLLIFVICIICFFA